MKTSIVDNKLAVLVRHNEISKFVSDNKIECNMNGTFQYREYYGHKISVRGSWSLIFVFPVRCKETLVFQKDDGFKNNADERRWGL